MKKYLIVGAGLSGCVIARRLAEKGFEVDVIDKRDHVAGNAYDYINEHGIRIHKYGPHIFHTNNKKVFSYLSQFTEWVNYKHKVKAILDSGRYVTLPVNRETADIVGKDNIIDTFIRPYSEKMWGMKLEYISPTIINRVPIRDDLNELYFPDDKYQYLPKYGYTKMVDNILDHPYITVTLKTSYEKSMNSNYHHIYNSMPIDEYFDYRFGELAYRSIKFHDIELPLVKVLPQPVVNFTNKSPYTRITEWKNFPGHGKNTSRSILTYEEPCDYKDNDNERYYPVKDINNTYQKIYKKYKALSEDKVTFIGRLGQYVYINMDQAVNASLKIKIK